MADKQTHEQSIREIDALIGKVAMELWDKISGGATLQDIDTTVGFLEIVMRRRRVILHEYKKAGGRVKNLNIFGAHIVKEGEPCT